MKISRIVEAGKALLRDGLLTELRLATVSNIRSVPAECTVCGYHGKFRPFGVPNRSGVRCPSCFSLERHRLFALAVKRGVISLAGKEVLNFAADVTIQRLFSLGAPKRYVTSAYPADPNADLSLDIEKIDLPDESFDTVICSHVLEHVDDRKALAELFRILRDGGRLLFMIPIIEGWETSYENPEITGDREREIHFGQNDHIRYYGGDIRERVRAAGFELSEYTANGKECIDYGLQRGEKIFIADKP
jgi:SAM-dependent methyltransferase